MRGTAKLLTMNKKTNRYSAFINIPPRRGPSIECNRNCEIDRRFAQRPLRRTLNTQSLRRSVAITAIVTARAHPVSRTVTAKSQKQIATPGTVVDNIST